MVISLKKWKMAFQFLLLFVLFTLLLVEMVSIVSPLFRPDFMYKEPEGGAMKVFAYERDEKPVSPYEEMKDRLKVFYWLGE